MSAAYLQVQCGNRGASLVQYATIKFDRVVGQSENTDIFYNETSGIIQINRIGVYYVDWFVVTDSAAATPVIMLQTILPDNSGLQVVSSDSILLKDEITGSAIVTVTVPGTQLLLTNGPSIIQLGNVPIVANLVLHSLDSGESTVTIPDKKGSGSVINFQNGVVDCPILNPFSWPVLLDFLDITWRAEGVAELLKYCSKDELEKLLGLTPGILSNIMIAGSVDPILADLSTKVTKLEDLYHALSAVAADAGLLSTDVYLNHASVEVVPSLSSADIPVLGLDGPTMPQILADGGVITAFAAEYDSLVSFDFSALNLMPGSDLILTSQITDINQTILSLSNTLGNMAPTFNMLMSPLPADYAERLKGIMLPSLNAGADNANHHVHAVLWHRSNDASTEEVVWKEVADLDLGAIDFLGLAPLDTLGGTINDIIAAGTSIISWILGLLTGQGNKNTSPTNVPFRANHVTGLNHPVSAGDYLLVQFKLVSGENITLLAGVIATNVMASVAIDSI